jgi:hypothetical protein
MNCEEFRLNLRQEARRPGTRLRDHAVECQACGALLEREQVLAAGFRALAGEWSGVQAPDGVEQRLVAAFRGHIGLGVVRAPRPWWVPVVTWGTAVAAVAAMALFLVRGKQPEPARRAIPRGTQLAMVLPGDLDSGMAQTYADGDFIPLPSASGMEPGEGVNLVRVELPRSSMIAMGFTVSAERAAEPVEADVMLGLDGVARAVRFVDE